MRNVNEEAQRDQVAYKMAREYLLSIDRVTAEMLGRHLSSPEYDRPDKLADVYTRILKSAQNAGMRPNVIGKAIGGVDELSGLLCGFDPSKVLEKYGDDWNRVLEDIVTQLKPRGQIRRAPRSLWPQFCKTIISGAAFMAQFNTAGDFYAFVDFFDRDDKARPSLPMLLSHEIDGFGFPLACDFLKELGYLNFGKPDVHLKKIFAALGLSAAADDYQVFKAIVRVARNVGVMPYEVDKLFWLVGSGNFHLQNVHVGRHRDEFISHVHLSCPKVFAT